MSSTLLVGAALDAGSMVMNSMAQKRMDKARATALSNQQAAQAALDAKISTANADALGQYQGFAGNAAAEQSQLGALYNRNLAGQPGSSAPTGVMPAASNTLIANEDAKQSAKTAAYATQQGQALAALDAPGQTLQNSNVAASHDFSTLGMLNNFKSGEAATLPYALDAANQQGAGLKTLGDLFRGGGSIATTIGLQNAFVPKAGAAAAAPSLSLPFFASGSPGSAFSLR